MQLSECCAPELERLKGDIVPPVSFCRSVLQSPCLFAAPGRAEVKAWMPCIAANGRSYCAADRAYVPRPMKFCCEGCTVFAGPTRYIIPVFSACWSGEEVNDLCMLRLL
ncbi:hypothetical protein TNCV_1204321 [Trichonephila clavipes]|nr:hypothetical protein TNCV_1204321 [Trichonephila clavipes]